ncbi:uncharacterized protein LOC123270761 [Cotesia glomerata]|uniref:Uncharacterized protein n=1 Tax=Cotesia glomerata TaxID=32391 RepID=A0AAV7IHQ3_COTGL|nr:uncharacterized protein LOC123270761 [Cotesia glomerata]KAH0551941.1 hypothetical protein KQX54_003315 [Cotesia glomerata]
MAIKILKSFCVCCDLKSGVLVLGFLEILGSLGTLLVAPIIYREACTRGKSLGKTECAAAYTRMGGLIISSVITLVLTLLMIFGSQMENPLMMLPIIILKGVLILVTFVATWYLSIYAFIFSSASFSSILFAGNISGGIMLYIWLVICSRREEIKNKSGSSNCA